MVNEQLGAALRNVQKKFLDQSQPSPFREPNRPLNSPPYPLHLRPEIPHEQEVSHKEMMMSPQMTGLYLGYPQNQYPLLSNPLYQKAAPNTVRPENPQNPLFFMAKKTQRPDPQTHSSQAPEDEKDRRRGLESAMLQHILEENRNIFSNNTDEKDRQLRLLKGYIELYAARPELYPVDPENKIHCVIHKAGQAVRKDEQQRKAALSSSEAPNKAAFSVHARRAALKN